MEGCIPDSYSLLEAILLMTIGRAKAINTDAAVWIPKEPVNRSILNPRANEEISNNQPGTSKGSNRIKYIYK
jgi:hypothetical protein